MERVSVLCLLLLLCSLSGAELQDNAIEQREASPENVTVPPSDLHAMLRDMSAKLEALQSRTKQLEMLNQAEQVAFSVSLLASGSGHTGPISSHTTLVFRYVISNVGNAYSPNTEQAATLRALQTGQVDLMKEQLKKQAVRLRELQTSEVNPIKEQLGEQAARLRELQTSEVNPIKEQLRGQAADITSIKARTNVTENHVDSLRRDRAVGQVAFSTSLLASGSGITGPFNTNTNLVFRYVISNIGNAYSPNTGFFTAPVRGAYHFELHIYGPDVSGAWLVKNGANICMAYEHLTNGYGKSSNGAALLLEAGDAVFVRQYANTRIEDNGNHHSTFSGHLLFPM